MATSTVVFLKFGVLFGVVIRASSLIATIIFWTSTVVLEGLAGYHTFQIIEAFKFSFMLFVFREGIFFFAIF